MTHSYGHRRGAVPGGSLSPLHLRSFTYRVGAVLRMVLMAGLAVLGASLVVSGVVMALLIFALSGDWQGVGNVVVGVTAVIAPVAILLLGLWLVRRAREGGFGSGQVDFGDYSATAGRGQHPNLYRRRAAGYRRRIQRIIRAQRPGLLADTMAATLPRLAHWQERVGELVDRLLTFENDRVLRRDYREVPLRIAALQEQMAVEPDPEIRSQMSNTLASYRTQQALMEDLTRTMRRTRLQLDDTLAAMGTVYSQVQMIGAMDIDGPQATQIASEIDEQVQHLNDLLAAMPEAYRMVAESEDLELAARRRALQQDGAASR